MQNAALEALGLTDWSYEAIDVETAEFARRARELPGEGFAGANITIPHKEAALAVADSSSEAALQIGAANTLSFGDDGIRADNTDAVRTQDVDLRAGFVQGAQYSGVVRAGGAVTGQNESCASLWRIRVSGRGKAALAHSTASS